MKVISEILRSLLELFIDDELLAVGIIAIVAMTAGLIFVVKVDPLFAGVALLVGNIAILAVGVRQTTKRRQRP